MAYVEIACFRKGARPTCPSGPRYDRDLGKRVRKALLEAQIEGVERFASGKGERSVDGVVGPQPRAPPDPER